MFYQFKVCKATAFSFSAESITWRRLFQGCDTTLNTTARGYPKALQATPFPRGQGKVLLGYWDRWNRVPEIQICGAS